MQTGAPLLGLSKSPRCLFDKHTVNYKNYNTVFDFGRSAGNWARSGFIYSGFTSRTVNVFASTVKRISNAAKRIPYTRPGSAW